MNREVKSLISDMDLRYDYSTYQVYRSGEGEKIRAKIVNGI